MTITYNNLKEATWLAREAVAKWNSEWPHHSLSSATNTATHLAGLLTYILNVYNAEPSDTAQVSLDEGSITANRVDDVEWRMALIEKRIESLRGNQMLVNQDLDERLEGLEDDMCRVLK